MWEGDVNYVELGCFVSAQMRIFRGFCPNCLGIRVRRTGMQMLGATLIVFVVFRTRFVMKGAKASSVFSKNQGGSFLRSSFLS